jgi:aminopeptidase
MPELEKAMFNDMALGGWARLALTGDTFPDIFADVDPQAMRKINVARSKNVKPYARAQMANKFQWCVAAVPTVAWAKKLFPQMDDPQAVDELWRLIFLTTRADQPDPVAAWNAHDDALRRIANALRERGARTLHFFDPSPNAEGQPSTNLRVGLTDHPFWVAAGSHTPEGVRFFANIPTEEIFSSPHRLRVEGYVRTSKPSFPMEREVTDATFYFEGGEVQRFTAAKGADTLAQFFEIRNAKFLGEVALVDVRSPINQAGVLFYDTLFDENAACHIAFGTAYDEGLVGAADMTAEEKFAAGLNEADTHVDFMIGTPTMNVTGICADDSAIAIMRDGKFVI